MYKASYLSPVGAVTLASDGDNLTGLWLEGQKYYGGVQPVEMAKKNDLPIFDAAKNWLDRYFSKSNPSISELPLAPAGSEFRQSVWALLCQIPYGRVVTYRDIAKELAAKLNLGSMSAQAVGGAIGHNPISIIIPCHRVVGANGSLTGYAGGLQTKVKLLELEKVDMSGLFIPKKKVTYKNQCLKTPKYKNQ